MAREDMVASEIPSKSFQHDMRPPAGILNVFSRLNYKPHYAIAEFVDNSTQSYFLHAAELEASNPSYQMVIRITYDNEAKTLEVEDNAFGMEKERFVDAITLDAKNQEQQNSRNEFGMGLKTAASWFGNIWSVTSTAYGSTNQYEATVNIPNLQETNNNNIEVKVTQVSPETHGTKIKISELTKGMATRSTHQAKTLLASMYRRDLKGGRVQIFFNDAQIQFEEYSILKFRDTSWKKPLDFTVEFGEKKYRAAGFVGILGKGGFPRAGFALFRRDRVIVGGDDQNYKPSEIFGQSQSPISHKLFGELDMDDFPVNQAKDGFIWDDGLEDEFIRVLKMNIQDFINIAKLTNKQRAEEEKLSKSTSDRVEKQVQATLKSANEKALDLSQTKTTNLQGVDSTQSKIILDGNQTPEELQKIFEEEIALENKTTEECHSEPRHYTVQVTPNLARKIAVTWKIGNGKQWIQVGQTEDEIDVTVDINHQFFKPYSNEEEFQVVLEKFVIAFVIAEDQAKILSNSEGLIPGSAIRSNMNHFLSLLGD